MNDVYLIDIGNTRIKATVAQQPFVVTAVTHDNLSDLLAILTAAKPSRLLLASGRSASAQHCLSALKQFAAANDCSATELTVRPDWLAINYEDTSQFGLDRFLHLLAARARYGDNFCVVSAGTAITLDFYAQRHRGGMILPGVGAAKSLLASKAGLHHIEKPRELLGNNTATSIGAGIYFGYRNLITSTVAQLEETYDISYKLILTGGDAEVLYEYGDIINHLLFEGMLSYL